MKHNYDDYDYIDRMLRRAYNEDHVPTSAFLAHVEAVMREADRLPKNSSPRPAGVHAAPHRKRYARRALAATIIAATSILLGVTAYAVYQARVQDYLLPESAAADDAGGQVTAAPRANLSMVGYQGTPEYEAYVAWETYLANCDPVDYTAMGVDDIWHETPDNYAFIYGAVTAEQGQRLEKIMTQYGLKPHTDIATVYDIQKLYDALGTKGFFLRPLSDDGSGYVYDDGTFKLESLTMDMADGTEWGFGIFVSAKGSFSRIRAFQDGDYEEWSYAAAGNQAVELAASGDRALILAETEGAYIYIDMESGPNAAITREQLETFANNVDFAAFAKVYGNEKVDLTDKIETLKAAAEEYETVTVPEQSRRELRAYWDDFTGYVADELGATLTITPPEGFLQVWTDAVYVSGEAMLAPGFTTEEDVSLPYALLENIYVPDDVAGSLMDEYGMYDPPEDPDFDALYFSYERLEDAAGQFAVALAKAEQTVAVAGQRGIITTGSDWGGGDRPEGLTSLTWYDPARDMILAIRSNFLTVDDLVALADTVTAA